MVEKYRIKGNESGRSMVEMLGVLAIMGVLTVGAVMGIGYMMDKRQANEVLRDAHMAYVGHESSRASDTEWHAIGFTPKVDLDFFYKHDGLGYCFVKVDQVPQGVCQLMLQTKGYADLYFFTEKNQVMETCPADKNNMILAFQGVDGIAIPCSGDEECPSGISFCDHDTGFCQICGRDSVLSPDKTKCLPVCPEEETACVAGKVGWCCPDELICGQKKGECIPSDGVCTYDIQALDNKRASDCSYKIENQVNTVKSDCSYKIENQVNTVKSDCSYKIENQVNTVKADCSYRISDFKEGVGSTVSVVKGCGENQYCALHYTGEDCSKTAGSGTTGIIYGSCHALSLSNQGCPITSSTGTIATLVKGCGENQYCALHYTGEDCSETAGSGTTGIIYGSCHALSLSNQGCPITSSTGTIATLVKGCGENQYCALHYTGEDCSETAGSGTTGIIYGSCHALSLSNQGCPITSSTGTIATPVKECGENQYCALHYTGEDCSETTGSGTTGIIYGSCHALSLSNQGCPITSSNKEIVSAVHPCPETEYCKLGWADKDCSSAGSGIQGPVYGVCIPLNTSSGQCPYR